MVSALFRRGSYFGVWHGLYAYEQAAVKAIRFFCKELMVLLYETTTTTYDGV